MRWIFRKPDYICRQIFGIFVRRTKHTFDQAQKYKRYSCLSNLISISPKQVGLIWVCQFGFKLLVKLLQLRTSIAVAVITFFAGFVALTSKFP